MVTGWLLWSGCCGLSNEPGRCSVEGKLPATVDEVPDYGPDGESYGPWVAVALADGPLSCGLRETGIIQCWGEGELPPSGKFDLLAAGDDLVCAQRAQPERGVVCWGSGALDSEAIDAEAPDWRWEWLAVGSDTVCWGGEDYEIGPGGPVVISRSDAPCIVGGATVCVEPTDPQPSSYLLDMDRGHLQWCGVRLDLALECWGTSAYLETPPLGDQWFEVDVGGDYACARTFAQDGLTCWGEPSMVAGTPQVERATAISAARDRACVLDGTGELYCWSKAPGAELVDCTAATHPFSLGELFNCDETDMCDLDYSGQNACCECNPVYCDYDDSLCDI
jgi:hypothetical protein